MRELPKRTDFPIHDRLTARPASRQPQRRTNSFTLLIAAVFTVALLVAGGLAVRSFVTGSGGDALPGVSFDGVVNPTADFLLDLLPSAFSEDDGGPVQVQTSTATPTPFVSPSPTPQPSLDPASVRGSPLSLQSLTSAWESKGLEATVTSAESDRYTGFAQAPVRVVLAKSGQTIEIAAFVYGGRDAIKDDWTTPTGERPSPKSGRSLPSHTSVWWNQNVVLVVLQDSGLSTDSREAFFDARP